MTFNWQHHLLSPFGTLVSGLDAQLVSVLVSSHLFFSGLLAPSPKSFPPLSLFKTSLISHNTRRRKKKGSIFGKRKKFKFFFSLTFWTLTQMPFRNFGSWPQWRACWLADSLHVVFCASYFQVSVNYLMDTVRLFILFSWLPKASTLMKNLNS